MKKSLLILLTSAIFASFTYAQFVVSGEIRPRGELRYGYKKLAAENQDPAGFVSQRTRLNFSFKNEKLQTYASVQNVSVWGDQRTNAGSKIASDTSVALFFEAWGELFLNTYSGIRLGRQSISLEDQRLMSAGDWNQGGAFLDGVLFRYENDSVVNIKVFGSYNNENENPVNTDFPNKKYKTFNFAQVKKDFGKTFSVTAQGFLTGNQKNKDKDKIYLKNTFGGYITYKPVSLLSVNLSGFYQNGQDKSGNLVSAYFAGLNAKISKGPFEVIVGSDYLSGQDINNTETNTAFDLLLGTRHSHYGFIDIFNEKEFGATGVAPTGLINPFIKTNTKFLKKYAIRVNYNMFRTQRETIYESYEPEIVSASTLLAHEIDVVFNWKINEFTTLDLGYSVLKAEDVFKDLKAVVNANDYQQWVWLQILIKPKFFDSSNYVLKQ